MERFWSPTPITGWKLVRPLSDNTYNAVLFTRAHPFMTVGEWVEAVPPPMKVPFDHPNAQWGFFAFKLEVEELYMAVNPYARFLAPKLLGVDRSTLDQCCLAAVELGGQVVEHEFGYRATKQRVLAPMVPWPRRLGTPGHECRLQVPWFVDLVCACEDKLFRDLIKGFAEQGRHQ